MNLIKWKNRENLPIAIVQNDNICRSQINPKATSSSCQQEDEFLATRTIIFIYGRNTFFVRSSSVYSTMSLQKRGINANDWRNVAKERTKFPE